MARIVTNALQRTSSPSGSRSSAQKAGDHYDSAFARKGRGQGRGEVDLVTGRGVNPGGGGTTGVITDNRWSFVAPAALYPRSFAITAVNQGTPSFTVAGDQTAYFAAGAVFEVNGSTGNDDVLFTVASSAFGAATVITVEEAIPDGTVDGTIIRPVILGAPAAYADGDLSIVYGSIAFASTTAQHLRVRISGAEGRPVSHYSPQLRAYTWHPDGDRILLWADTLIGPLSLFTGTEVLVEVN